MIKIKAGLSQQPRFACSKNINHTEAMSFSFKG